MMNVRTLDDLFCQDKVVLVRGDLDVPIKSGRVADSTRLERLAVTIKELQKKGAKVVLMGHLGRPADAPDPQYSLKPVVPALEQILNCSVRFAEDCIGKAAQGIIDDLKPGEVVLLENLRFHPGEKMNDPDFAVQLAALGDVYVGNAFANSHRKHASMYALPLLLESYAGRLMEEEVSALTRALESPKRPVCAIVGGAKISTKLGVLTSLVVKVDKLILGGGMANTFLFAQGHNVGLSLCEQDMADQARNILKKAEENGCDILLQIDAVVAPDLIEGVETQVVDIKHIPEDQMILDVGPQSVALFEEALGQCKTVVWNGPVGAFEVPPFDAGTKKIAHCVADLTAQGRVLSVAGGGDTVAALAAAGVEDKVSYISTAGGAFLEWLEGKDLPGLDVLRCQPIQDDQAC